MTERQFSRQEQAALDAATAPIGPNELLTSIADRLGIEERKVDGIGRLLDTGDILLRPDRKFQVSNKHPHQLELPSFSEQQK